MNTVNSIIMLSVAVSDMKKSKDFYSDKLGLKIVNDYRIDDSKWWVSLAFLENSATLTLTTTHENMMPGIMKMYFSTNDISLTHKQLIKK